MHGVTKGRIRLSLASGRAARGSDRQRVRNAADASRPVGSAARSAALHGGKGGAHPRQPARDSGKDARLREVRPGPRVQPASWTRWACSESMVESVLSRAIAHACRPFPAHEASGQPARLRSRHSGCGAIVEGTYQSPILVQWHRGPRQSRVLDVTLTRFV